MILIISLILLQGKRFEKKNSNNNKHEEIIILNRIATRL
jgi:hypothetical protein